MTLFHFNFSRLKQVSSSMAFTFVLSSISILGNEAHAEDGIQYFNQSEMDYWKKPEITAKAKPAAHPQSQDKAAQPKDSSFPWKKYIDPKNDEFFKEGDYLPPAPFMEIARDPSDENIEHWFKYLEAKNQVTQRLQAKLSEYAAKHPPDAQFSNPSTASAAAPIPVGAPVKLRADARRFRLRLYFDSKCPHCEHMIETLKALSLQGFSIELKQVDSDTQARSRIPFPVSGATAAELKQYKIEKVPVLLVGDLKARSYFTIQGYQNETSVLNALTEFASKQEGIPL